MPSEWFYQIGSETFGPVSGSQLRTLVQRGTVCRGTWVKKSTDSTWVAAGQVQGLSSDFDDILMAVIVDEPCRPSHLSSRVKAVVQRQFRTITQTLLQSWRALPATTQWAMGIGGVFSAMAVGYLMWFVVVHDTWELDNKHRLIAELDEAVRLQETDPDRALLIYGEVFSETKNRRITDERLSTKLRDAQRIHDSLFIQVEARLKAEEDVRRKKAEEYARQQRAEVASHNVPPTRRPDAHAPDRSSRSNSNIQRAAYNLAVIHARGYVAENSITVARFRSLLQQLSNTYEQGPVQIADISAKAQELARENDGIEIDLLEMMEGMNQLFVGNNRTKRD